MSQSGRFYNYRCVSHRGHVLSYSLPVSESVDINLGFCCWIYSSACKNDQSQKGGLWFPFQPLKPLSEKFRGLLKILLSKTLHGVLFFIFHKVNSNVSFFDSNFQLFVKRFSKVSLGYKSLLGHKWYKFLGRSSVFCSLFDKSGSYGKP